MTTPTRADVALLEKLVLGQCPAAEAERLAVEYADDSRVAELAEALSAAHDPLLDTLRHQQTPADPGVDSLAGRLVERLRRATAAKADPDRTTPGSADDPSERQPMPERLEYFRIRKVLGEGGMGTVYLADDTRLGRQVALKTLRRDLAVNPAAKDRFLREARSAASLEHDHVIPIYYVGEADGIPFLAMPLLQGEPLNRRLEREGEATTTQGVGAAGAAMPLPIAEAVRIAGQIARGLASAHGKGLIHRDVKPGNVWLEAPTGRVKILDFGLARSQREDVHLTATGAIVGTPSYLAPEQARGSPIDQRADLFSLGCVLYEMLTGRRPFTGPDTLAILTSLALDTPRPPHEINPRCPAALSRLTMQLLAKEPAQRPASAQVVADALASMGASTADDTADVVRAKTAGRGVRRRSRALALAAVVLLALVPLGWWLAPVVLRLETANGTLIVEINDDETEARIKGGKLILTDSNGKTRYVLSPSDRNRKIDAGEYQIHVEGVDGLVLDTKEFTLKKGDKVTVRVTVAPKPPPVAEEMRAWEKRVSALPARKQVEEFSAKMQALNPGFDGQVTHEVEEGVVTELRFVTDRVTDVTPIQVFNSLRVLDCGGTHTPDWRGNGQLANLTPLKGMNLTALTDLNLSFTKVGDAGLAHFAKCKNLTRLNLRGTQVSDEGLARFSGCKKLTLLYLGRTQVGDAGLAYFKDCKSLTHLNLNFIQATDEGLAHFSGCKNLEQLDLGGTQVGDVGLANFANCKKLTHLYLYGTQVSDRGLARFRGCKNLEQLYLANTQVGDVGLVHFRDCEDLTVLDLAGTKVGDRGLAHFAKCKNLTRLDLSRTQVGDAGLVHFKGCKSLTVLLLGGTRVGDRGLAHFKDCKNLTQLWLGKTQVGDAGLANFEGRKKLTHLHLWGTKISDEGLAYFRNCTNLKVLGLGSTKVSDKGLANFEGCKDLTFLSLQGTQVGDEGLAHFAGCKSLRELHLFGSRVSDAGLAHFEGCKDLTVLNLDDTRVGDAGLAHLAGCKNLKFLRLAKTQVSDKGMVHLKDCKGLEELSLSETKVGDAGLAHFSGCKNLTALGLANTQVSDAGLAHFSDCKSLTNLNLLGTKVSDAGLAHLEGCKDLASLWLTDTQVGDAGLAHLEDRKKLTHLHLRGTQVTDLSPLKGMPLKELWCDFCPDRDTEILRSIKTLEKINGRPVDQFWKAVDVRRIALEEWLKRVSTLPAEKQVEEFRAKMKERNPGFDGKEVTAKIEEGVVTEIRFVTDKVTDVAPLRVFDALRVLDCSGTHTPDWTRGNGQLADLTPLKGMNLAGLTFLNLAFTKVGDADMAHFAGCKNLTQLRLASTKVGDAGLAHFSGCKNLRVLSLARTQVSDAGLAHFSGCKNLTILELPVTQVGDAGLARFEDCKNLTWINLGETKVSDAGLAHFAGCKNLTQLHLESTKVSDAGLAYFKDCKNLTWLELRDTQGSDTGLAHFAGCKNLTYLGLGFTKVSDAGLAHFKDCKNLTLLNLQSTAVTDLSPLKGMPLKELWCDFCPDRDTEILRSIKTLETINGKPAAEFWKAVDARKAALEVWLKRVSDLPAAKQVEEFRDKMKELNPGFDGEVKAETDGKVVTEIRFVTDKVTDVAPLRVFGSLRVLDCSGTHTDWRGNGQLADLTPLKGMNLTGLTYLNLTFTKVSDTGLAHFKDCKNLEQLYLGFTTVGDAGLAHFEDCKNLTQLSLDGTRVSDVGLAHFKGCKNLTNLGLWNTQVSDAGLAHFSGCKNLRYLNLNGTKVSDGGLAVFKDCKSLAILELAHTKVSDAGLAHFKDRKNLTGLRLEGTQVTDLSLLKGLSLKELWCDFCPDRDTKILRPIKTLETINDKPAAEFWKAVDARKAALEAWLKRVSRLSAEKQVEEFRDKMKELNPGFDGVVRHKIEGKVVTEIRFVTDKVTDVAPLRVFGALRVLDCRGTHTPDWRGNGQLVDLTPLKGMNLAGLTELHLYYTKVGDAGLAHFKDCKNLTKLSLHHTQVGDAGVARFSGCKNLTWLDLGGTKVSEKGLAHFSGCKGLTGLNLRQTQVDDAGLAHFSGCENLTSLNLKQTRVTRPKIDELHKALPKCKIEWDGGVIEPKAKQ